MPTRRSVRLQPLVAAGVLGLLAAGTASAVVFDDIAAAEGIAWWRAGDVDDADHAFLERMGGGACWLDADLDGLLDLYLVNGRYNGTARNEQEAPRSALYRQLGGGLGFDDLAASAGVAVEGWAQGCAAADYDADGAEDLLVYGYGLQRLFRNQGDGTFAETTDAAGIVPALGLGAGGACGEHPCWSSGAAWADYDRDGCLDVYIIRFIAWARTEGTVGGPLAYPGQPNQLLRSNCDGTFADVTAASGTDGDPGPVHAKDWGVTWTDFDRDGWLDIYVASDATANILYRNDRDGTFTDLAAAAGVADDRNGMGLTAGDCNGDAYEELFFTHYSAPIEVPAAYDGFYVNNGNGTFTDRSGAGDLNLTWPYIKWGTKFEDFDNDGDLDLHLVTGHTEPFDAATRSQPMFLWMGDGACNFADARAASGPAFKTEQNSRGSSYADHDADGDVDIAVVNILGDPAQLLEARGAGDRWLLVELRQPGGNPRGIGAEVTVEVPGGATQRRVMNPYQSLHGSNPAQLHIGLGNAGSATVTVRWPGDNATTTYPAVQGSQLVRFHRDGRVQTDTYPPHTSLHVEGPAGDPGWWRADVDVTLGAADRSRHGVSGVARTLASIDGGPWVEGTGPFRLGEGLHEVRYRSVDREGNAERVRTARVGVDALAPSSTATLEGDLVDGTYRGPVRVTLACADAGSGPAGLAWRIGAEPWVPYEGPFDLERPGDRELAWRCTDAAGNVEPEQRRAYRQDLGHPGTAAVVEGTRGLGGWWRSAVRVHLDAHGGDANVTATYLSVDGAAAAPYAEAFELGDGAHTLVFWSVDDIGRTEPARTVALRVDATPPSVRITDAGLHVDAPSALIVGPRNQLVVSAEDAGSGVVTTTWARGAGPERPFQAPLHLAGEGSHAFTLRATDAAGNVAVLGRTVTIDATPPTVGIVRPRERSVMVGDLVDTQAPLLPLGLRAVLVDDPPLEASLADALAGPGAVTFLVDGEPRARVEAAPWVWRYDVALWPGTRTVTFTGEDRVGNARSVSFTVFATGAVDPLVPLDGSAPPAPSAPPIPVMGSRAPAAPVPAERTGGSDDPAPPLAVPLAVAALAGARLRRRA